MAVGVADGFTVGACVFVGAVEGWEEGIDVG